MGAICLIAMAKKVTAASTCRQSKQFGIDKVLRRIACDDGTTYVFARTADSPRWRALARYSREGERSPEPARLPAAVEAHMDGFTQSGPYGPDGDDYWV